MKFKMLFAAIILFGVAALSSGFIYPTNNTSEYISPAINADEFEKGGQSFAEFLSHFKKTELPYQLTLEDLKVKTPYNRNRTPTKKKMTKKRRKHNPYVSPIARTKYIPEVANGLFGRMGPPQVEAIARFFPSKNTVAVIYTTQYRYDIAGIGKQHKLLVFDLKGDILFPEIKEEEKVVYRGFPLGYSDRKNTITCTIDKEGHIWKKTYDNEWEKDVRKNGIEDNEIISYTLTDTEVFKLNEKGIAVQLKELPISDRASLD